jgi:hypothetical protein
MRDTDLRALESAVSEQIVPPSFDALVANAARRRRNAYAAAGTVAAGALAVSAVVATAGGAPTHDEPAPPVSSTDSPTPSPTTASATASDLTLEQIVHDPDSILEDFAASPSDADARAVVWRACRNRSCVGGPQALAVTSDGFATASYVALPREAVASVTSLGGDDFLLSMGGRPREVIDAAGVRVRVSLADGPAWPLQPGETLVPTAKFGGASRAIDPATAVSHPVPGPGNGCSGTYDDHDGHLVAIRSLIVGTTSGPQWAACTSVDGGASWAVGQLPTSNANGNFEVIPSAYRATAAVLESADNTVLPLEALWRSADDGQTWRRTVPLIAGAGGDTAYVGGEAVQPDGSLLVYIIGWSDATIHHPSAHLSGLYRSNGTDWSTLSPAPQPAPAAADTTAPLAGEVREVAGGRGGAQTLYVQLGQDLYATDDGGGSWERVSDR